MYCPYLLLNIIVKVIIMYESYAVVGERGQITLPKIIREKANIKSKERLIVKIENNSVLIEKEENLNKKNKLMEKGYKEIGRAHV